MKRFQFILLIFAIPFYVAAFKEGNTQENEGSISIRQLELIIQQQQHTLSELKKQLNDQQKEITSLKDSVKKGLESTEKQFETIKEEYKQLTNQIAEKGKQIDEQLKQLKASDTDFESRLNNAAKDVENLFREFQTQINLIKERITPPFHSVQFDGIEFVHIPAGQFMMGTTEQQKNELDEKKAWKDLFECELPSREVTITKAFFISTFEITQNQWSQLMGDNNASFKGGDHPIETVNWYEVQEFIQRLNNRSRATFRLPTEAEWEYCARAGDDEGIFGDGIDQKMITWDNHEAYAWSNKNSDRKTHPIGRKKPNAWGLHDMLGNVWEWCQDWYDCKAYERLDPIDPLYNKRVTERVFRGGCWALDPHYARPGFRGGNLPDQKSQYVGFRLVRELSE